MDLLILGASTRSAGFSALRAGFAPFCVDLFCDQDLVLACDCDTGKVHANDYPEGLAKWAESVAPTRWLYTGALENHPDLVARISQRHELLGVSGADLYSARNPFSIRVMCQSKAWGVPEVRLDPEGLPTDGSWLIKPMASAGGRGIRPFQGRPAPKSEGNYYQQRIRGLSLSAIFLGKSHSATCLGITRQFIGKRGNRFAYRGTLAPWPVPKVVAKQIAWLGWTVAINFGLKGLFGIDLILEGDQIWVIEINPRYTAAVEALEWATGQSFLRGHVEAFGIEPPPIRTTVRPQGFVGKLIVYADHPLSWNEEPMDADIDLGVLPEIADVPWPGTSFEPGEPVMTVLASGDSPADCLGRLTQRIKHWRRRLSEWRL